MTNASMPMNSPSTAGASIIHSVRCKNRTDLRTVETPTKGTRGFDWPPLKTERTTDRPASFCIQAAHAPVVTADTSFVNPFLQTKLRKNKKDERAGMGAPRGTSQSASIDRSSIDVLLLTRDTCKTSRDLSRRTAPTRMAIYRETERDSKYSTYETLYHTDIV